MTVQEILEKIAQHRQALNKTSSPNVVIEACAKISIYLADLSDIAYDLEKEYKVERADKYIAGIKSGASATKADKDASSDPQIIEKGIYADRIKAFIKRMDTIISVHQSLIRIRENEANRSNL